MSSISSHMCSLASYKTLYYSQGAVDIHTTGIVNSNDPMFLSRASYWKGNSNFTKYFLNLPAKALASVKNTCKLSHCDLEMIYQWEGGIPVSEAMGCFEDERCTITAKWDGQVWTSQMSKEMLQSPSFQIPNWEKTNYIYANAKAIEFTHSFNGPKTKTVYFNRVKTLIRARQNQFIYISRTPIYFWLKYPNLLPMHGVFGLNSEQVIDGR